MIKEGIKELVVGTKESILERYKGNVNGWKHKYGTVKVFYSGEDESLKAVFFRQPTRQELSSAEQLSMNNNGDLDAYKKADRHIVDCYLGGDLTIDQITNDTSIYMPLARFVLFHLIDEKKSSWETC